MMVPYLSLLVYAAIELAGAEKDEKRSFCKDRAVLEMRAFARLRSRT